MILKLNSWQKYISILAICLRLLLLKKMLRRPLRPTLKNVKFRLSSYYCPRGPILIVYGINCLMVQCSVLNIKISVNNMYPFS